MSELFSSVQYLRSALDYHQQRQDVLVSNVSNVDTPGYVPRDLARVEPASFGAVLQVAMSRTNASHLVAPGGALPTAGRVFEDPSAGGGNDKNFVSLDREAAKVAANHIRYDVVSTLVSAELSQLAFAAGDGRSG